MKLAIPKCPKCGELAHGTVENIPGVAEFSEVDDDGVTDHCGETDVFWDGQEQVFGENGKPLVECGDCYHHWETDIDWEA